MKTHMKTKEGILSRRNIEAAKLMSFVAIVVHIFSLAIFDLAFHLGFEVDAFYRVFFGIFLGLFAMIFFFTAIMYEIFCTEESNEN